MTGKRIKHPRAWAALAAALALVLTACGSGHPAATPPPKLFAEPGNPLATAASHWRAEGKTSAAKQLMKLAAVPQGIWLAGQSGGDSLLRTTLAQSARAHAVPTYVVYNLPHRDACGHFSAAQVTGDQYHAYVSNISAILGQARAIVVVEPDAIPDVVKGCLSGGLANQRYDLLRFAMQKLSADKNAHVFLDAGNPGMEINYSDLATALQRAGIRSGAGFSANVSNFFPTATMVAWSQAIEHVLGGHTMAIIDTSRNGNGVYTGPVTTANPAWCNPPGRAIGDPPAVSPGPAGIYAYDWVKDIWASDGPCRGGPKAGDADAEFALKLGTNAHQS